MILGSAKLLKLMRNIQIFFATFFKIFSFTINNCKKFKILLTKTFGLKIGNIKIYIK